MSRKNPARARRLASGILRMQIATLERIRTGQIAKGDVLTVADVVP